MKDQVTVNVSKLKKDLKTKVLVVEFQKLDGSKRTMKCTKDIEYIQAFYEKNGEYFEPTPKTNRKEPEFAIPVFDVEKEDWRSFRWDKVITYRELTGSEYRVIQSGLWEDILD